MAMLKYLLFSIMFLVLIVLSSSFSSASSDNSLVDNSFKICGNDELGQLILGNDYYILCENDFSNYIYFVVHNETNNGFEEVVPKPNMYPETLFEMFFLVEEGYSPQDVFLTYLDDSSVKKLDDLNIYRGVTAEITFNQLNILNNKLDQLNINKDIEDINFYDADSFYLENLISELDEINDSEIDFKSNNISLTNDEINLSEGNLLDNVSFEKVVDSEDEFSDDNFPPEDFFENAKPNSLLDYLKYLAMGLIILLGIYFLIHSLETKHHLTKEVQLLKSYVVLLHQKGYSQEEIRSYFLKKGYSEKSVSKALKTQVAKP